MTLTPIAPDAWAKAAVSPGVADQILGDAGRDLPSFQTLLEHMRDGGFLGRGGHSKEEAPPLETQLAQVFNELGLFGHSDGTAASSMNTSAPAAPASSAPGERPDAQGGMGAVRGPDEQARLRHASCPTLGRSASMPTPSAQAAPPPPARPLHVSVRGGAGVPSYPIDPRAEERLPSGAPAARPRSPVRQPSQAARTGAALALLHQADGAVVVSARADGLGREERLRLRVAVEELLARHGYVAADYVLNGTGWTDHAIQGEEHAG
jgi:hypothetical protein